MSSIAITLMIVALVTVWGGLLASAVFLARRPHATGGWADHPEIDQDDEERSE